MDIAWRTTAMIAELVDVNHVRVVVASYPDGRWSWEAAFKGVSYRGTVGTVAEARAAAEEAVRGHLRAHPGDGVAP